MGCGQLKMSKIVVTMLSCKWMLQNHENGPRLGPASEYSRSSGGERQRQQTQEGGKETGIRRRVAEEHAACGKNGGVARPVRCTGHSRRGDSLGALCSCSNGPGRAAAFTPAPPRLCRLHPHHPQPAAAPAAPRCPQTARRPPPAAPAAHTPARRPRAAASAPAPPGCCSPRHSPPPPSAPAAGVNTGRGKG